MGSNVNKLIGASFQCLMCMVSIKKVMTIETNWDINMFYIYKITHAFWVNNVFGY